MPLPVPGYNQGLFRVCETRRSERRYRETRLTPSERDSAFLAAISSRLS